MKILTILAEKPADYQINFDQILDNFEQTICIVCGKETNTYWDQRYNGIRASCSKCEMNWAES